MPACAGVPCAAASGRPHPAASGGCKCPTGAGISRAAASRHPHPAAPGDCKCPTGAGVPRAAADRRPHAAASGGCKCPASAGVPPAAAMVARTPPPPVMNTAPAVVHAAPNPAPQFHAPPPQAASRRRRRRSSRMRGKSGRVSHEARPVSDCGSRCGGVQRFSGVARHHWAGRRSTAPPSIGDDSIIGNPGVPDPGQSYGPSVGPIPSSGRFFNYN